MCNRASASGIPVVCCELKPETRYRSQHTNLNLAVKPPWSPQGGVDGIWTVRRADDDYPSWIISPFVFHTIKNRQQGRHNSLFYFPSRSFFPSRNERVDFVEHDDARTLITGLLEDLSKLGFSFPMVGRGELRAVNDQNCGFGGGCNCAGQVCFPSPRRTVKEYPSRRLEPWLCMRTLWGRE